MKGGFGVAPAVMQMLYQTVVVKEGAEPKGKALVLQLMCVLNFT